MKETVYQWWVALYPHPPSNDRECREFQECIASWKAHPSPSIHCLTCKSVMRCWHGTTMACANPRCVMWGRDHHGDEIVGTGTVGDTLHLIRDGVVQSQS